MKNSASGNEFMESELIDKVKIILPLHFGEGEIRVLKIDLMECKTLSQNCQNIQMMMNKEIETDRKEILPLFFCSKTFLPHSSICQKPTAKVLPDTLSRDIQE